jgi:hypothetical protein
MKSPLTTSLLQTNTNEKKATRALADWRSITYMTADK